jgi:hypothetical protein
LSNSSTTTTTTTTTTPAVTSTVSVSFADGFVGDFQSNNAASSAVQLSTLGWTNIQFQQTTSNGLFWLNQGNDIAGVLVFNDAQSVQHRVNIAVNWRTPSGNSPNTMVAYVAGTTDLFFPKLGGGMQKLVPIGNATTETETFIGLSFNGTTAPSGSVSGNAATLLAL